MYTSSESTPLLSASSNSRTRQRFNAHTARPRVTPAPLGFFPASASQALHQYTASSLSASQQQHPLINKRRQGPPRCCCYRCYQYSVLVGVGADKYPQSSKEHGGEPLHPRRASFVSGGFRRLHERLWAVASGAWLQCPEMNLCLVCCSGCCNTTCRTPPRRRGNDYLQARELRLAQKGRTDGGVTDIHVCADYGKACCRRSVAACR